MRIAAYCRVSTEKEDQLNSLETQKRFFVDYAEKNRHELVRLYADEGISGTKIRRRVQFQQMMQDAEQGLFEMVVVKDISRMARNTVDLLQSVRRLKALGIRTEFLTANMNSMGDSEFILTVFGALAQEESANTSKRVKFGKRANAEKGRVPNLVYGYDKTIGDYFHLDINPREAEVVRQIFHWYLEEGCGGSKIANMLNRRGLKTKRGCDWNQAAVCRILSNPIYTGVIINGKQEVTDFLTSARADRDQADWLVTERPELRIISDADFRKVRELMKSRNRMFHQDRVRHSNQHLFSALIRCRDCGWSFRRVKRTYKNTYVRWACSKHNGQGIHNCGNAATVDENELIEELDTFFLSLMGDENQIRQLLRQKLRKKTAETDAETAAADLTLRQKRLKNQREKYLELYADELLTRDELHRKLESTKAELEQIETELRQLQASAPGEQEELVRQVQEHLKEFTSLRHCSNSQLRKLVDRIEVDSNGSVEVFLQGAPPVKH